jgi:hypothetical protein
MPPTSQIQPEAVACKKCTCRTAPLQLPGRPTRDCLMADPNRDGKTVLKVWNLNADTGVVGVFNLQVIFCCCWLVRLAVSCTVPACQTLVCSLGISSRQAQKCSALQLYCRAVHGRPISPVVAASRF